MTDPGKQAGAWVEMAVFAAVVWWLWPAHPWWAFAVWVAGAQRMSWREWSA